MSYTLQHKTDILQDRFGLKVASRLSAANHDLPYDVSERLRAARQQALSQRKQPRAQTATAVTATGGGTLALGGGEGWSLWGRLASALPVVALAVGMVAIKVIQDDNRASELAEVDVAILTDNLPPQAYADPGFLQFLRVGGGSAEAESPAASTEE